MREQTKKEQVKDVGDGRGDERDSEFGDAEVQGSGDDSPIVTDAAPEPLETVNQDALGPTTATGEEEGEPMPSEAVKEESLSTDFKSRGPEPQSDQDAPGPSDCLAGLEEVVPPGSATALEPSPAPPAAAAAAFLSDPFMEPKRFIPAPYMEFRHARLPSPGTEAKPLKKMSKSSYSYRQSEFSASSSDPSQTRRRQAPKLRTPHLSQFIEGLVSSKTKPGQPVIDVRGEQASVSGSGEQDGPVGLTKEHEEVVDKAMKAFIKWMDSRLGVVSVNTPRTAAYGVQRGPPPAPRRSSTEASKSKASPPPPPSLRRARRKRVGEGGGGDGDGDDGGDEERKDGDGGPGMPNVTRVGTRTEEPKMACPFFKHNPRKYKMQRPCSGPGWDQVHRIKEHIYRKHSLPKYRCHRCCEAFETEEALQGHARLLTPCQVREQQPASGITQDQERKLRSRKKHGNNEPTEYEKWRHVYSILFPDVAPEKIPSAYYGVEDDEKSGLDGYEDYLSRELPPAVRRRLEEQVENELNILEDDAKRRVVNIVRDLQVTMFRGYQQLLETERTEQYIDLDQEDPETDRGKGRDGRASEGDFTSPSSVPTTTISTTTDTGSTEYDPGTDSGFSSGFSPTAGIPDPLHIFTGSDWDTGLGDFDFTFQPDESLFDQLPDLGVMGTGMGVGSIDGNVQSSDMFGSGTIPYHMPQEDFLYKSSR